MEVQAPQSPSLEDLATAVGEAAERLAPFLPVTPLRKSLWLSDLLDAEVWLKCENLQPTGSFKVRGALNKLVQEVGNAGSSDVLPLRVVAASTGNHGAAVAFATRRMAETVDADDGLSCEGTATCTVFVPEGTASAKLSNMQRLGAEIRVVGTDSLECEIAARAFAQDEGALYVSPYNDPLVVAGQGTAAVEIDQQLEAAGRDSADVVVASLGGGGLISGLAAGVRLWRPRAGNGSGPLVVAASPERSKVMHESVRAGRILDLASEPTLSDGTAGGVEPGAVTFGWARDGVGAFVLVSEDEIARTLYACVVEERLLVEGAAAVAIAGAASPDLRERIRGKTVVVVLCGANVPAGKLSGLLEEHGAGAER